jgi:hypothetical protein
VSESQTVPDPTSAGGSATAPAGFFSQLTGLYLEPRAAFTSILRTPGRWWVPLILSTVLQLAFMGVWLSKMDPVQHARLQLEESPFTKNMPPEQLERQVEGQARSIKFVAPVIAFLIPPVGAVILGAVFLVVYRFFYGGEVSFKQSLAVNTWIGAAVGLVSVPLMLAIYAAKGDWNIDPSVILQANLSLLFTKGQVSPVLYALAGSLDLFSFWVMFLLATGYAVLLRKPTSAAAWGVLIPWAVVVLIKLGFTALMG